jgi:hypothetical protein
MNNQGVQNASREAFWIEYAMLMIREDRVFDAHHMLTQNGIPYKGINMNKRTQDGGMIYKLCVMIRMDDMQKVIDTAKAWNMVSDVNTLFEDTYYINGMPINEGGRQFTRPLMRSYLTWFTDPVAVSRRHEADPIGVTRGVHDNRHSWIFDDYTQKNMWRVDTTPEARSRAGKAQEARHVAAMEDRYGMLEAAE